MERTKPDMAHFSVTNPHGDFEESIERLSLHLGKGQKQRKVFDYIYGRGSKPKTFENIYDAVGGDGSKQVIRNIMNYLESKGLVHAEMVSGDIGRSVKGYSKVEFVNANREKIRKYADRPELAKKEATKRRPTGVAVGQNNVNISLPRSLVKVEHITIDDIDSFKAIRSVKPVSKTLTGLTEEQFRLGVQSILDDKGTFKDWGGEKSDLLTTRLVLDGKRVRAAFAFKGPGKGGKLTIAKMGKNGDQAPRLFEEPADLYVVQHWNEIDSQVHKLMEALATAKSATSSQKILICIIDGQDSERLVRAYPEAF